MQPLFYIVTKNGKSQVINPSDLSSYLQKGWSINGELKKT